MKVGPQEKPSDCYHNSKQQELLRYQWGGALTNHSGSTTLHILDHLGHFWTFWQTFPDPEEWAELVQLPMHNLLLKLLKPNSKEPVVIAQVNINLIDSFLNVMTCTDNCSCLQGFLAVPNVFPVCLWLYIACWIKTLVSPPQHDRCCSHLHHWLVVNFWGRCQLLTINQS